MKRLTERKIILIKKRTRLEDLISRYNTIEQAKFYIEHLGSDFSDYVQEDRQYKEAVSEAQTILEALGRVQVVDRDFVPNFIFGEQDIVVAVGQDGLVANTLKYLDSQPLIGVNPDPARWDGILLPFEVSDLKKIVPEVLWGMRPIKEVTMAKASLNDGQVLYAVNDLFIGQKTHISSRYRIQVGNFAENQSSSGIIVSTGLGSTGWLKSILTGAANITNRYFQKNAEWRNIRNEAWNADYLYYSVREPFPSKTSAVNLVFGKVTIENPLKIQSHMPENGVIFSDGIEKDFLEFNAGVEATISIAEKRGQLVQ